MKGQKHNEGELSELTVSIEKNVYESSVMMAQNAGMSLDELVVIALKRFRASHADLHNNEPPVEWEES